MLHSQTQGQTPISPPNVINSQAHSFISFTSDLNNHLIIITFLVTGEKICLYCSIRETRFIVGVLRVFFFFFGFYVGFFPSFPKLETGSDPFQSITWNLSWRHSRKRLCSLSDSRTACKPWPCEQKYPASFVQLLIVPSTV